MEKLSKMLKIAEVKNDVMGQFHNALYIGDVQERVKILENAGQLPLAYVTASVHGLTDTAERLATELGDNIPSIPQTKVSRLLMPPSPLTCSGDWPLLRVMRGIFEGGLDTVGISHEEEEEEAGGAEWDDEDLDIVDVDRLMKNSDVGALLDGEETKESDEEGGWDLEDLELPPDVDTPKAASNTRSLFVAPTPGMPVSQIWIQKSSLAGEHAAAGNFDTAIRLLSRQLGIKNFAPLKSLFMDLYTGSHSYLYSFPSVPAVPIAIEKGWSESTIPNVRNPPALVFKFSQLEEKLKLAYRATTEGKFPDALRLFLGILHTIPLIVVDSRREVDEVKELIEITREYVLGLKMEFKRKELKDSVVRQQELAAYFTNCKLQKIHLRLVLLSAMSICYKGGNFSTAANFARMLLDTNPTNENHVKRAKQVLNACGDKKDSSQLNYDFRNPFVICGATYVPIYRGQKDVACPYCGARFVPSTAGQICQVCELAMVGSDASGLLCSPTQTK